MLLSLASRTVTFGSVAKTLKNDKTRSDRLGKALFP